MALTVTLLGGESTGKTTLARALQDHLEARPGIRTVLVPEHLRDWCERQGRAPHAEEQAAIAQEQARLMDAAAEEPGLQLVIADTSALMVAAYSELYFNDRSLYPAALAHQRTQGLTLLMGLDLPWVADDLFRDSPAVRAATDAVLRRELQAAGIGFQTVYGQGGARLAQALRVIGPRLGCALLPEDPGLTQGRVPWNCDTCSDPECEHRLFTGLVRSA